jgi:hypothetical protein
MERVLQLLEIHRFDEVVRGAELEAGNRGGGLVHAGQHDDGKVGVVGQRLGEEVDAGHAAHADVAQHRLDPVAAQLRERLLAVLRLEHGMAEALQERGEDGPEGPVVLDQQHAGLGLGSGHVAKVGDCGWSGKAAGRLTVPRAAG